MFWTLEVGVIRNLFLLLVICFVCLTYSLESAQAAAYAYRLSYSDGTETTIDLPFDAINSVAVTDLGGDGTSELVFGAPTGTDPKIYITRLDGSVVNEWYAYDPKFRGGVNVATGDIDGDGVPEIVTAPAQNGGSHIRVFDGYGKPKGTLGFFATDESYVGSTLVSIIRDEKQNTELISAITSFQNVLTLALFSATGDKVERVTIEQNPKVAYSLNRIDLGGDGYDELLLVGSNEKNMPTAYLLRTDGSLINSFLIGVDDDVIAHPIRSDKSAGEIIVVGHERRESTEQYDGYGAKLNETQGIDLLAGSQTINVLTNGEVKQLTMPYRSVAASYAGKAIVIDLSDQQLSYFENGFRIATTDTSTGKPGYETPVGTYAISSKTDRAYSKTYGLYMPYWMSFIGSAYGIHELPEWPGGYKEGADHLGKPVSHGCVRVGVGAAEMLYNWADVGTTVVVQK